MGKIHTLNEIETKITSSRNDELLDLSELIADLLSTNIQNNIAKRYKEIIEIYNNLNNELERDMLSANIAFIDEKKFLKKISSSNIKIMDLLLLNSKAASAEIKKEILRRLNIFRIEHYKFSTITELVNKLNQLVIFKPNLLTPDDEIDKLIEHHTR